MRPWTSLALATARRAAATYLGAPSDDATTLSFDDRRYPVVVTIATEDSEISATGCCLVCASARLVRACGGRRC